MILRHYQQAAVDAAFNYIRKSNAPCLIDAATGAGKSIIIAKIAQLIYELSNKNILVLAPSAELVHQDREKFLKTGYPASMFSASAGAKCLRHPVVFGSPRTVLNSIDKFGSRFALIIVDEAHGITPTLIKIIDSIKEQNPNVRVLGLTATPYRMNTGYIYLKDQEGNQLPEDKAHNPFFHQLVYRVSANELINEGYLTRPVIGEINAGAYDTSLLKIKPNGKFDDRSVEQAFVGHGRETAQIIADVVNQSLYRQGVMIFAATIAHAHECMASLPNGLSAIVTGETPKEERKRIIARFKRKELKYLVNVAVLTTGFDAPHVSVIALLRATESPGLLQQIIGRGLRIDDSKEDCLILDYANNIENHAPDGDIFNPEIKVKKQTGSELIECECPDCGFVNHFAMAKNDEGYEINRNGYFIDLEGNEIMSEYGPIPAHYGRRCASLVWNNSIKSAIKCGYRWTGKECPKCGEQNDITARYCAHCNEELVNPNEKLIIEYRQRKKDPYQVQTDNVLGWEQIETYSRSGNLCYRIDVVTAYRKFTIWIQKEPTTKKGLRDLYAFMGATDNGTQKPVTITYQKETSGFYRVLHWNQPEDKEPGA